MVASSEIVKMKKKSKQLIKAYILSGKYYNRYTNSLLSDLCFYPRTLYLKLSKTERWQISIISIAENNTKHMQEVHLLQHHTYAVEF